MTEKSEKMLIKHWVTATSGFKKTCIKVSIKKEHGNSSCEDWE
jgi:hypothetical protein